MKFVFKIIFLFLLSKISISQTNHLRLIEKGKYAKAEKKILKSIQKDSNDVKLNYTLSVLLIQKKYKGYDTRRAYLYMLKAKKIYSRSIDEREKEKLNKIPINNNTFQLYIDTITSYALDKALKDNTVDGFDNYLSLYKEAPNKYRNIAIDSRDVVAYEKAKAENTVTSFDKFISTYPNAKQIPDAIRKRNQIAFNRAQKDDNISSYKEFIKKYPDAIEIQQAWSRIHELAYQMAIEKNSSNAFQNFMSEFPNSKQFEDAKKLFFERQFYEETIPGDWNRYAQFVNQFNKNPWKESALDSIYHICSKRLDIHGLEFFIENCQSSKRLDGLMTIHDYLTDDGEKKTLDEFYSKYNYDELDEQKEIDYELAELGDQINIQNGLTDYNWDLFDEYIKSAAPKERAFNALQRMIAQNIFDQDYTTAFQTLESYLPYFEKKPKKIENLMGILSDEIDRSIQINAFGPEINSNEGKEYIPVISADNKTIYFCGRYRPDNLGGEDIYVSSLKNKSKAHILDGLSTSHSNEAPLNLSVDGTTMIIFKDGNLNISQKTITGWSQPSPLSSNVNSAIWQSDVTLSSDGKALLFASIRNSNFDYYINKDPQGYHSENEYASDIYVSLKDEYGEWGPPVNLGPNINTMYGDRSPFLHPDMKTLYFSSSGHGGLGGLDVFKSTRLSDTCWTCWSEPINLGKEINTPKREWCYSISTDGQYAYFSKQNNSNGGEDLFWLNLPKHLRPNLVATIEGKLKNSNNEPIAAEIFWEDLTTGKNIGSSKSDPTDGSYFIVLPLGKLYGYYIDKDEYFPTASYLDLRTDEKSIQIENNVKLVSFEEMINEGIAVPINNLFFDYAKFDLLPYSIPELERVAEIIKENKLNVEIIGHTDNKGENKTNQVLSENRANAVKTFLVGRGCEEGTLHTIGYGETKPIADNNSEIGRAKNRRVELRFVQ